MLQFCTQILNARWFEVIGKLCFLKAQSANSAGDSTAAMEASKKAKMFNIIGLVCGIILIIIVVAVQLAARRWPCLLFAAEVFGFQQCSRCTSPPTRTPNWKQNSLCTHTHRLCTHVGSWTSFNQTPTNIPQECYYNASLLGGRALCFVFSYF